MKFIRFTDYKNVDQSRPMVTMYEVKISGKKLSTVASLNKGAFDRFVKDSSQQRFAAFVSEDKSVVAFAPDPNGELFLRKGAITGLSDVLTHAGLGTGRYLLELPPASDDAQRFAFIIRVRRSSPKSSPSAHASGVN